MLSDADVHHVKKACRRWIFSGPGHILTETAKLAE